MEENKLEKRKGGMLGEKTQYVLTFVVIAAMLYVAQFPSLVIFFFGIFAYLLWKAFAKPSRHGVKEIFDFYVDANELLREDERRWFGFEVREVISKGERITRQMNGAPPLVFFALGALYNKNGDHKAAIEHLEFVLDDERSDEGTYMHPSRDLRNYVRVLRKIEREPVEAPQVSAAVRSLERKRKNKVHSLLEDSMDKLDLENANRQLASNSMSEAEQDQNGGTPSEVYAQGRDLLPELEESKDKDSGADKKSSKDNRHARKPISEVLHDIYDKNIQ